MRCGWIVLLSTKAIVPDPAGTLPTNEAVDLLAFLATSRHWRRRGKGSNIGLRSRDRHGRCVLRTSYPP